MAKRVELIGTPIYRKLANGDVSAAAVKPWEQEARDSQGRKRFHGAFEGGFTAGYHNTVGSKEGWTPSTFFSSRQQRADTTENKVRPEDLMDEEDLRESSTAGNSLKPLGIYSVSSSNDVVSAEVLERSIGFQMLGGCTSKFPLKSDIYQFKDKKDVQGLGFDTTNVADSNSCSFSVSSQMFSPLDSFKSDPLQIPSDFDENHVFSQEIAVSFARRGLEEQALSRHRLVSEWKNTNCVNIEERMQVSTKTPTQEMRSDSTLSLNDRFVSPSGDSKSTPKAFTPFISDTKDYDDAASKGMYGKLTRHYSTWEPAALLLKRFNIKELPTNSSTPNDSHLSKSESESLRTSLEAERKLETDLENSKPSMELFKAIFSDSDESDEEENEEYDGYLPTPVSTLSPHPNMTDLSNDIQEQPFFTSTSTTPLHDSITSPQGSNIAPIDFSPASTRNKRFRSTNNIKERRKRNRFGL